MPPPDHGDELATLHVLYFRADYLRRLWLDLSKEWEARLGIQGATSDLESGYALPMWVTVTLHLASLYTVVEGWNRVQLKDTEVEALLAIDGRVDALRAFRDGVFHYGAANNTAILSILENRELLRWAGSLHDAFGRFMASRASHGAA